ncbi:uncharacterized protein YerC [Bradyrhizobium sp. USDA 4011]
MSSSTAVIARLDRAIQYAAASRLKHCGLWNTRSPACAGDDTEQAEQSPVIPRGCEAMSSSTAVIARLDRAIQYAVAPRLKHAVSGILDHLHARVTTLSKLSNHPSSREDVRLCPRPPLSSPGLTGRSSTPQPLGSNTPVSGILDHPHARVMTLSKLSNHLVISRGCEAMSSSTAVIARLDRAIQYAAAPRLKHAVSGILDHSHARVTTLSKLSNHPSSREDVRLCPRPPLSSPGLTGRSSTPQPLGSNTPVSGILDHPHARVMTLSKLSNHLVISRGCEAMSSSTAVIARLDRAIQYAAAPRLKHCGVWNTGLPACAGDDTEQVEGRLRDF